jgi:hypothetical protein
MEIGSKRRGRFRSRRQVGERGAPLTSSSSCVTVPGDGRVGGLKGGPWPQPKGTLAEHETVIDNGARTMHKALARVAPRAPHHFRPRFPTASPHAPRFSTSSHAKMTSENKQPQVEYRRLGNSGLRVSVPILGAMSIGTDKWAPWVINEDEVRSGA